MKYWFVPSNDYTYRIGDSIKENHGAADWRQSYPFSVGDIVFVFKPKPENFIRYKMEVTAINIPEDKSIQKEKYWMDKFIYYEGLGNSKYVRFQLMEEYAAERFPLASPIETWIVGKPSKRGAYSRKITRISSAR